MSRSKAVGWSLVAWLAVGVFWLITTHRRHPTWLLAVIVTISLVVAYAAAAYLNHLVLLPKYWRTGRRGRYALLLLAAMIMLTGAALAVIRVSYLQLQGPDQDPNGLYIHFGIDFFGMAVHLLLAAGVVGLFTRVTPSGAPGADRPSR